MLKALFHAILEWFAGWAKAEIKQDVKANDVDTPKEIVDDFRSTMRRKLRDNEGCVCEGECRCGAIGAEREG